MATLKQIFMVIDDNGQYSGEAQLHNFKDGSIQVVKFGCGLEEQVIEDHTDYSEAMESVRTFLHNNGLDEF